MLIPKTRKEIYQAYLSGDTHLELPKPVTRDEIILYNACINGAGTNPSWNDLTDKPFYDNSIVIENKEMFDGAETDSSGRFLKLSGDTVPLDLLDEMLVYMDNGSKFPMADEWGLKSEEIAASEAMAVVYKDGASFSTFTFPTAGVYAIPIQDGYSSVLKFVVEDIKPIDPKYIVLTSPNGNKFNLSVSDSGTLTATEAT